MTIRICDRCRRDMTDCVKKYKLTAKVLVPTCKGYKTEYEAELCEDCYQTVIKAVKGDPYQKGEG